MLGALHKAQQIEVALQAKAFSGSRRRTYLHDSRLGPADYAVLLACAGALTAAPLLYWTHGIGRFWAA
jgi:energy-coupling factor transport system permease protein